MVLQIRNFSSAQCHLRKVGEMALLEKEMLLGFSLPARLLVTYNIYFKILSLERNGVLERNRDTSSKATSTLFFQKVLCMD